METVNQQQSNIILESINDSIHLKELLRNSLYVNQIHRAGELILHSLSKGKKIMFCGNGGSAADSQHLAAEFVVRYKAGSMRPPLHALALTTDSSILTACANDYSFNRVFQQQVEAVGNSGDVLVLISTSGNSENLVLAAEEAKKNKISTIGLLGASGGRLDEFCDIAVHVPSRVTARIQECHILIGHIWCDLLEHHYSSNT